MKRKEVKEGRENEHLETLKDTLPERVKMLTRFL